MQKGGGVLGVALVGYTYILELVGIRFLRLAGTSAGAINTALMTVIEDKQQPKSKKILEYLCTMDFFSFVDGHPFARWLIRNFVSDTSFEKKAGATLKAIFFTFGGLVVLDTVLLGLRPRWHYTSAAALLSFVLTGISFLLILLMIFYGSYMLEKLKAAGYGINPGVVFYNWVKDRMEENGVATVTALNAKASAVPPLIIRPEVGNTTDGLFGDVTFITSELVTENKLQLPLMTNLFRVNVDDIHPARFVRASMAIPFFFESHIISGIPVDSPAIQQAWFDHLKIEKDKIPDTVRLVDGGMLSDFPINIFYNPKVIEPRLPVFGIDLDDSDPRRDTGKNAPDWSLADYIGRLFNTIRYYYDRDFLEKDYVFKRGIGAIPLFGINWLNFFLSDEQKLAMFRKGALAATEFLLNFDWPEYRRLRIEMQQQLNKRNRPPLN